MTNKIYRLSSGKLIRVSAQQEANGWLLDNSDATFVRDDNGDDKKAPEGKEEVAAKGASAETSEQSTSTTDSNLEGGSSDSQSSDFEFPVVQPDLSLPQDGTTFNVPEVVEGVPVIENPDTFYKSQVTEVEASELPSDQGVEELEYSSDDISLPQDNIQSIDPVMDFKAIEEAEANRESDTILLEVYLSKNYFNNPGVIKGITGKNTLQGASREDIDLDDLMYHVKSTIGSEDEGRVSFPNLSDSDIDVVMKDLYISEAQKEEENISKQARQRGVQLAVDSNEAIEVAVFDLEIADINTHSNKDEVNLAKVNKELRIGNPSDENRKILEARRDELIDSLFYKDELKWVPGIKKGRGGTHEKTGNRIPKGVEYKMFHDPNTGRNISAEEAEVIAISGGEALDISSPYEGYIATFGNTSQDKLERYYSDLLLEEQGFDLQGAKVGDFKVGDKVLAMHLRDAGFEMQDNGVFKDVPLNLITKHSNILGASNIFYRDFAFTDGDVTPQSYDSSMYSNQEEFVEYVKNRKAQQVDIAAKKEALWQVYHLNKDVTSIEKTRTGQILGPASKAFDYKFGEGYAREHFGMTNMEVIDIFKQEIVPSAGLKLSKEQERHTKRTLADKGFESIGGLASMAPDLFLLNKATALSGITKVVEGLMGARYLIGGANLSRTQAIAYATKKGKDLSTLLKSKKAVEVAATNWQKGKGLAILAVAEEVKMKEGLGALTGGQLEFQRGVGAGFALGGKLLPYTFKNYTKYNRLNTALELTLKNGPAFAIAAEAGEAIDAIVNDLQGTEEIETFLHEHWGDYDENFERTILHLITGSGLGLHGLKANDVKTYEGIAQFRREAQFKSAESRLNIEEAWQVEVDNRASNEGIQKKTRHGLESKNYKNFIEDLNNNGSFEEWCETQRVEGNKDFSNLEKYQQDYHMAESYLDKADDVEAWLDPVKGKKLYDKYYEPLVELYKEKGKELVIELTDKTIYQKYVTSEGKYAFQEVNALYEFGKGNNATKITIDTTKSKGRDVASHEALHAYFGIMFEGKPQLKTQFEESFKKTLSKITAGNGKSVYDNILEDQAITSMGKRVQLEEMMTYTAEYLSKKENQHLMDSKVFSKVAELFNNFSESVTGKPGDLFTQKEIINMLGRFSQTGNISELKGLKDTYVEIGDTETFSDKLASKPSETVRTVKGELNNMAAEKKKIIEDQKSLIANKPEGYKDLQAANTVKIAEINNEVKSLEKISDEGNPRTRLNKFLSEQVVVEDPLTGKKTLDYKSKFTKEQLKDGKGKKALDDTFIELTNSEFIKNRIKQGIESFGIPKGGQAEKDFVQEVIENLQDRLTSNFNPGKNNDVFGWLEGVSGGDGFSIMFRAKGDAMVAYNKRIKTNSYDANEGMSDMFMDESTGGSGSGGEAPLERYFFRETISESKHNFSEESNASIDDAIARENIDVSGLEYKDVKKLIVDQKLEVNKKGKTVVPTSSSRVEPTGPLADVLKINSERHGIPIERILANQTLSQPMRTKARDVIYAERVEKISALPEGTTPSGKSTGVATSKLGDFYLKKARVSSAKTGSTQGNKEQKLKDILMEDYLAMFGIKTDGTHLPGTTFDGAIKQQIIQETSLIVNQSARKNARDLTARIGEGRGIEMASKDFNKEESRGKLGSSVVDGIANEFSERFGLDSNETKDIFDRYALGVLDNKTYVDWFERSLTEDAVTRMREVILTGKELEAIVAKETIAAQSAKEYVENIDFESSGTTTAMEMLSDRLGFKVTPKHLKQAANNTIQRSRFTGKKNGKNYLNRKNIEGFRLMAGEYFKLFPESFGITFAKNMIGDPLSGRKNGWHEIINGELVEISNTDPILSLNEVYKNNVGKSPESVFEGLTSKYAKGSVIAKAFAEANKLTEAGDIEAGKLVIEKVLTKADQKLKRDLYQALGKAQELFLMESKNATDYVNRATFNFDIAKNNTGATEGERILTTSAAVRLVKGEGTGLNRPLVKELIEGGMSVEDALKKDHPKVEHVKSSLKASFDKAFSVNQHRWSSDGISLGAEYLGVHSTVGHLDVIDVIGLKTNTAGLARFALHRKGLKDNLEIKDGKFTGKTLEDVLIEEAVVELQSLGKKIRGEELKQDYMFDALNSFLIESSPGMAEFVSQTAKNKDALIKEGNIAIKAIRDIGLGSRDLTGSEAKKAVMTIEKAIELGRKRDKTPRKMYAWDLDGVLIHSKSGVRYSLPNPSGKPQPGRKVIFMAGGAGSGKSGVVKALGLEAKGFKTVNQDISLEWLKKNAGLPTDMRDLTSEQLSEVNKLSGEARRIAKRKQGKFKGNGDGVVVDGTGGSLNVIKKKVQEFKDAGYDVQMVFVETSLDVAQSRNASRKERSLGSIIVEQNHKAVQGNKEAFKELFGDRFAEVNTDMLSQKDAMPKDLVDNVDNFVSGHIKARLDAGEFASLGAKLKAEGAEFDFSEFNIVKEGTQGPFFQKALAKAKKYGNKNQFIITARMQEAAGPIHEFLKSQGLDIPLENITGLGKSEGEAKAMWMLEKFAEGYNDMYFADDAIQNVEAVKKVLDQLDIKSKVQLVLASKNFNAEVNDIMKHSLDIEPNKVFSKAEAKIRGANIKRRRIFMTDSAADLELLLEPLYGKGKKGTENQKWFGENFVRLFERGHNNINNARQKAANGYMALRKQNKKVVKSLDQPVEGTSFTTDMALRTYIWNKNGMKIPGLAKVSEAKLVEHVKNNPELQAFAENFARLTGIETGLREPSGHWWSETIASEMGSLGEGVGREKYLQDWIEAKNEIFSEENLNKMETKLGSEWRKNVEEMFTRMETGKTRKADLGNAGNAMMDYLNGSVGTIMSLNTRSATLQLISSVNFINHDFNNPLSAAKAFANQPQYWKDFAHILNSDMLKQRRSGLQINVTEAELAAAASGQKNKAKAVLAWILKQGYLPTKVCDSFAIASGGATYYRNAIRKYTKEGLSKAEAEKKAWIDFQAVAERTQQSSRPDLLSAQQVSVGGRIILPFANTPMQMNRIMMKELLDIKNGRYKGFVGDNSITNKMSKVGYYGFVQSAIFAGLQSGLFALLLNSDDDELIADKKIRSVNTIADSFLRGMGIQGAVLSGIKNALLEFQKQNDKSWGADYDEVYEDLLNMSPTVGSKIGKLDAAGNTYQWNKKEILNDGLTLDGPALESLTMATEALLNIPVNRVHRKIGNIQEALNEQNAAWQRIMVGLGWSQWDVGIGQRKKAEEKVIKDKATLDRREAKKVETKKAKQDEAKRVTKEKETAGIKEVRCSGKKSNGERCSITIESKAKTALCSYHKTYKPTESSDRNNNGIKEYQCTARTGSGRRCNNRTENRNNKCYAHQ